ncbi:MAG: RluA family pseudouridine synthase [Spirosomataceae bacterium]
MNKDKSSAFLKVTEPAELMAFLIAQLPHKNRNNIKTLLRDKQVLVEGRVVTQYNHQLLPNQKVEISGSKARKEKAYPGLTILFEDSYLIVIEKQEGLLSIATDNRGETTAYRILSDHVKKQNAGQKIFVVHRLDRDTSGVMVFAKSEKIQKLLQETWGPETKERTYLAVAEGVLVPPAGTVLSYLNESKAMIVYSSQHPGQGQKAITHYETIRVSKQWSLLKVNLETGRKNQIRVHLQDLGHPIAGDKKYGARFNPIGRLGLHAWILGFVHPITKEKLRFETKIPPKFLSLF